MLKNFLISHFTISTLHFKSSISPYIYVHRKILVHTAKSSSITKDTRNPSYWPETPVPFLGRHSLQFFQFCTRASTFFSPGQREETGTLQKKKKKYREEWKTKIPKIHNISNNSDYAPMTNG